MLPGDTWFFLLTRVKNYRSATLSACIQCISDPFPRKRLGLARVGRGGGGEGRLKAEVQGKAESNTHAHRSQHCRGEGRLGDTGRHAEWTLQDGERELLLLSQGQCKLWAKIKVSVSSRNAEETNSLSPAGPHSDVRG